MGLREFLFFFKKAWGVLEAIFLGCFDDFCMGFY